MGRPAGGRRPRDHRRGAGLFVAGTARNFDVLAFGLAFAACATLFWWWMIKTAFDESEEEAGQLVLRE